MTEREIDSELYAQIQALNRCRFLPASYEKRFARDMAQKQVGDTLTLKQLEYLEKILKRYRKQLSSK